MKNFHNIVFLIASTAIVSACIPSGAGDNRPRASSADPQLVTDNVTILEPDFNPSSVNRNANDVIAGEYIVKSRDTLSGIAQKTGSPQSAIAQANGLEPPFALRIGQVLQIPSGTYHRVNSGETGIAIARAYGVPWSEIVALNELEAPFILRVGQRLKLPRNSPDILTATNSSSGASSGPVSNDINITGNIPLSPEERASAFSLEIDDIVTGGQAAIKAPAAVSLTSAIPTPAAFNSQFIYPLRGRTLSRFGSKGGGIVNDGINIEAAEGAPIGAAADGVVVYSGNEIAIFGGLILVDHGGGWVTAYGHVKQIDVNRGQKVAAGQIIGQVGQTGYVDRPQLHFEIRKDRKPIDPLSKLPNN